MCENENKIKYNDNCLINIFVQCRKHSSISRNLGMHNTHSDMETKVSYTTYKYITSFLKGLPISLLTKKLYYYALNLYWYLFSPNKFRVREKRNHEERRAYIRARTAFF